jgi:hypothetical protein
MKNHKFIGTIIDYSYVSALLYKSIRKYDDFRESIKYSDWMRLKKEGFIFIPSAKYLQEK